MNPNFGIEVTDDSAENVSGGYFFGASSTTLVRADISEKLTINKNFFSNTLIRGNFAGGEASATALGANTATQAISSTNVVQGLGSTSNATSISGTSGNYHWW